MESEIQKAVESGKLTAAAGASLLRLAPGTFVTHKSWGFGQVDGLDFLVQQMTINFKAKRGHSMQLQYAAESLTVIAESHILARKSADLAAIKTMVKKDPAGLVRTIVESFGGKATQDQIASVLVPDVLNEAECRKWWTGAKAALKKNGHFTIPVKKTDPVELRDGPVSHAGGYVATFSAARQPKDQSAALDQILKNLGEFTDTVAELAPIVATANESAKKNQRLNPSPALSLLLGRDELVDKVPGLTKGDDAPVVAAFLREAQNLADILNEVPAAKMKRALAALPEAFADVWTQKAISLVLKGGLRLVGEAAKLLVEQGKSDDLRAALAKAISERSISSAALQWLCGEREGEFGDLANHHVLSSIFAAMERDQHNEKRERKLQDMLANDQTLLTDLISDSSAEELREIMRKLLMTTVFEDLNKRSMLGRIIRVYPELGSMVSGEGQEKEESLIVSWESLEKRRADLEDLIKRKLPENVKEIAVARSYGDLRENFEYKAAKEMQRVLNRRRAEMEIQLSRARGTDFANPDATQVSIGTIVTLRDTGSGREDRYSILGAWDGNPDKNIISYQAAIAQAIIGRKAGDKVSIPAEVGERPAEIVKIEVWRKD